VWRRWQLRQRRSAPTPRAGGQRARQAARLGATHAHVGRLLHQTVATLAWRRSLRQRAPPPTPPSTAPQPRAARGAAPDAAPPRSCRYHARGDSATRHGRRTQPTVAVFTAGALLVFAAGALTRVHPPPASPAARPPLRRA
jgi:hypothetical protein